MRVISYKRDSMISQALGCLLIAAGGVWLAFQADFNIKFRFFGGFLAVCLPFVSAALFIRWKGGAEALRFDARQLHISTLYRQTSVAWSDVRNIQREKLTQSSGFGLIKQDIAHYLVITTALDGGFERTFRVQEDLLDWPKDAREALAEELSAIWAQALRSGRDAPMPPPAAPPAVPLINGRPLVAARPAFGRKQV